MTNLSILEREPTTRLVRVRGTLGIQGKLFVAFPGPNIPRLGKRSTVRSKLLLFLFFFYVATSHGRSFILLDNHIYIVGSRGASQLGGTF